jgi:hypothetical protein
MIFIVLHDRTPRIVDPITAQAMSDFGGRGDITNWSRHVSFLPISAAPVVHRVVRQDGQHADRVDG